MELLQLKYFCETAKNENLSETAKKFYVPTSNISSSVKRLERELGCELFNHFSNKITLNENGKLFYDRISRALSLIEDAKTELDDNSGELKGEIFIRCKSNRGAVTQAMENFHRDHPKVKFNIAFGEAYIKNPDLFISYDMPIPYNEKILLIDEDIPIAMRYDHPLANRSDLTIKDLEGERFIVGLSIPTVNFCNAAGFHPNIAFEFNDPAYVRKYLELGLGIAFIPKYSWEHLLSDKIHLHSFGLKRKTFAYLPKDKYTKRATKIFLDYLINVTKDAR
jgi:DNA-binding transcriptional LysR family regulator